MFKVEVIFVWTLNEIENIFFYAIDLFSFVCLLSRFRPRDAPFTCISLNLKEIVLKGNITCSIQWAQFSGLNHFNQFNGLNITYSIQWAPPSPFLTGLSLSLT